jgi:hypothetical protein
MAAQSTIISRLMAVLVPTPVQGLGAVFASLLLLAAVQVDQLLKLLGVGEVAIAAARAQLHDRFIALLTSPIASTTALVTFWSSIGLISYLICWGAYNLLLEARNEVTLKTSYTNRGHWRGHLETLGLKSVGAVVLIALIALLKAGLALWIALVAPALVAPGLANIAIAVAAALGLAVQLYLILALALVTFTPWYRAETFTDR